MYCQRGLFIRKGYRAILGYCPEKCEIIEELLIFSFNDFKRKSICKPTIIERIREHLDQMQYENSPHYDYKEYFAQDYDLIIGSGGVVNGETWKKAVYCRNYEEILSELEEQSHAMEESSKSRRR